MNNGGLKLWKCPHCDKKMLAEAKETHLEYCMIKNSPEDLKCKWCGKTGFARKSSHSFHENRCYQNPNRKPWTFEGKIHKYESKIKQAKSFIPDKNIMSLFDVSSRTRTKILERMKMCCSLCGWSQSTVDLHHIISKKEGR